LTSRQQTKRERQGAKKRAEREERIRAAKRRQRQRLGIVLGILGAGIVAGVVLSLGGADEGSLAGGGANCDDAAPEAVVEPGGAYSEAPAMQIDCSKDYQATIKTNHGDITLKLYANAAPVTVNNFVALARDGFYDGLTFHRIIDGFMIQGGDPKGNGSGGPGYKFQDEFDPEKNFDRPYRLAMANSTQYGPTGEATAGADSNGSQFFITVAPTEHLNQRHTIFGQVIDGQDVVDEISKVETASEKPLEPVTIEAIEIAEVASSATPTTSTSPSIQPTSDEEGS
jgi:peptidyl-prolyl cis-trans isomerase A (cyclophilin A)